MIDIDVRAHALEFGTVHKALRENGVFNHADTGGGGEERGHLGLHIGRVGRVGGGADFHTLGGSFAAADGANVTSFIEIDVVAGSFDGGGDSFQVFTADTAQGDSFAGERGGGHECAGFDAVWDDGVLDAVKGFNALDNDAPGARTGDFSAHQVEEIC